jgi:hypothetical protein
MKKKKLKTLIVLAVEIAAIVVLHAIKISQGEKALNNKEMDMGRSNSIGQQETKVQSSYYFASMR